MSTDSDASEPRSIELSQLFDDQEADRIHEAASARSESSPAFLRDAILDRVADVLGEEGHLECWVDGCDETFTSERRRRGHVGRVHSNNLPEGDFWCGICGYGPTTYPGVGAHHGHRHSGEEVRPVDHEPAPDELLDPGDVPDHMDRELLDRLYDQCDGNIAEMLRRHDFEVTHGRVRHYLIEYGIHDVLPNGTDIDDDRGRHRDREFMVELYEACGGNMSEMYRRHDFDIGYSKLVWWCKKLGIHEPGPPKGRHVERSSKSPRERKPRVDREPVEPPAPEDVDGEPAYVLKWERQPPRRGTYHLDTDCRSLQRRDSEREVVALPRPIHELEQDDGWEVCGHCLRPETDQSATGDSADPALEGVATPDDVDERSDSDPDPNLEPVDEPDDIDDVDVHEEPAKPAIEWDFEPGWQTVGEQEEVSTDRLVDEKFCPRCGGLSDGEGLCESCADGVVDDLVTDGGWS